MKTVQCIKFIYSSVGPLDLGKTGEGLIKYSGHMKCQWKVIIRSVTHAKTTTFKRFHICWKYFFYVIYKSLSEFYSDSGLKKTHLPMEKCESEIFARFNKNNSLLRSSFDLLIDALVFYSRNDKPMRHSYIILWW